jgi:hypothetical protein
MSQQPDQPTVSLADVAAETPAESVEHEKEILGDGPDQEPVVPEDSAQ